MKSLAALSEPTVGSSQQPVYSSSVGSDVLSSPAHTETETERPLGASAAEVDQLSLWLPSRGSLMTIAYPPGLHLTMGLLLKLPSTLFATCQEFLFLLAYNIVISFVCLLCETRDGTQVFYPFSSSQTQLCAEQSKYCGFLLVVQSAAPKHTTSSSVSGFLRNVV